MDKDLEKFKELYRSSKHKGTFIPFNRLIPSIQELFIVIILLEKYNIDYTVNKN